ncbi:hypothetical protein E2I00_009393, partial [Balaenoptera physalus]
YLIFKKRIFKTLEVAKTEGQESDPCRPNVADRLETEANFSGCGGHEISITVYMWQMPVHPQTPRFPSHLLVFGLPLKWELYPGRRYQATDSRLWEIVDHGQANQLHGAADPKTSAKWEPLMA